MTSLGVHSEVGKLRQVIVHRPDLSLKRLTPGNHDELLFEGPEAEAEQVREIAVREMADAYPLDPPLAVEAGIGDDWLSAK